MLLLNEGIVIQVLTQYRSSWGNRMVPQNLHVPKKKNKERKKRMKCDWLEKQERQSGSRSWVDSNGRERACLEGSLLLDRVCVLNTEHGVRIYELSLGHLLVFLKRPAGRVTHVMETAISCSPPSHAQVRLCGHCAGAHHTGRASPTSAHLVCLSPVPWWYQESCSKSQHPSWES